MILAYLIRIIHIVLVIMVVVTPILIKDSMLLVLHILVVCTILLHWKLNNNICILTLMEGWIRGIPYEKGFLHQLIGPVFDHLPNTSMHILSILLIMISMHRIYTNGGLLLLKNKVWEHRDKSN